MRAIVGGLALVAAAVGLAAAFVVPLPAAGSAPLPGADRSDAPGPAQTTVSVFPAPGRPESAPGPVAAAARPEGARFCLDCGVPRVRRPGAMGLALTAFEVWRRLPPAQRRMILDSARKQAPRAAAAAVAYWRARRPPR